MFDVGHIPNTRNGADIQVFRALGSGDWQAWVKPRGKSMVSIFCLGAAGGGGGGLTGAAGTARGGGGGGGSGAQASLTIAADALPDQLFCNVGIGGLGGTGSGVPGASGQRSIVSLVAPLSSATSYILLASGAAAAGGGGAGSAASPGAAGIAESVATRTPVGAWGNFSAVAGVAGAAAGAVAGAVGGAVSLTQVACGGCGGGSTTSADFNGGNVNANGWLPNLAGGIASGSGNDGYEARALGSTQAGGFVSLPGTGGGASNASTGGNGGRGGTGSGGGGGGGGTTGGQGGRGGDGLIMIVSW